MSDEMINVVSDAEAKRREIHYSVTVQAGPRVYYLDVKKSSKGDPYIAITESKKNLNGPNEKPSFEKHKVLLYQEDFGKFAEALNDVFSYISELDKAEGK